MTFKYWKQNYCCYNKDRDQIGIKFLDLWIYWNRHKKGTNKYGAYIGYKLLVFWQDLRRIKPGITLICI